MHICISEGQGLLLDIAFHGTLRAFMGMMPKEQKGSCSDIQSIADLEPGLCSLSHTSHCCGTGLKTEYLC